MRRTPSRCISCVGLLCVREHWGKQATWRCEWLEPSRWSPEGIVRTSDSEVIRVLLTQFEQSTRWFTYPRFGFFFPSQARAALSSHNYFTSLTQVIRPCNSQNGTTNGSYPSCVVCHARAHGSELMWERKRKLMMAASFAVSKPAVQTASWVVSCDAHKCTVSASPSSEFPLQWKNSKRGSDMQTGELTRTPRQNQDRAEQWVCWISRKYDGSIGQSKRPQWS